MNNFIKDTISSTAFEHNRGDYAFNENVIFIDNVIDINIDTFEFEGNIKNYFARLGSNKKIKFSIPNADDTSDIHSGSNIQIGFNKLNSVILKKGQLAVDT